MRALLSAAPLPAVPNRVAIYLTLEGVDYYPRVLGLSAANGDRLLKRLTCLSLLVSLLVLGACQTPNLISDAGSSSLQTFYLVRHAEKQTGTNPSLTQAGQARAERLAKILSDAGLTHIHSTETKRTLETAAPIAALSGLPIARYGASDLPAFADTLRALPGRHLIVGHSNTTPGLAAALGGDPGTAIDEKSEYDRLYVIELSAGETLSRIERYGVRYQAKITEHVE